MKALNHAITTVGAALILSAIGAEAQDPLKPMTGKWKAMLSYTGTGGRFTTTLAEDTEVKQVDQNTIEVSLKPVSTERPVFVVRLSRNPASKNHILTVKTDGSATIDGLALSYGTTGFQGDGTLKDAAGQTHKVRATIVEKSPDEYEWSFRNPDAPAGNDIVFSFTFFKRL